MMRLVGFDKMGVLVAGGCFSISFSPIAPSDIPAVAIPVQAKSDSAKVESGKACYYSVSTNGTTTASGERLKDDAATAAHRTLPFGTKVKVTNVRNGRSVVVRITDRGPFSKGRIIDVTESVAKELGFFKAGIASVEIEVVK